MKLGNNPTNINKASLLELESTNQGLLLPRISDTMQAPLNSAPDGMLIYFTGDSSLLIRESGHWVKLADLRNLPGMETDPVATAKTVTVNAGSGLSGGGSNTLGNSPSFTLKADTGLLATQYYVNSKGYLTTETDPVATAKTVSLSGGTGISITGASQTVGNNPSFSVAAQNSSAIWNANKLQGVAVSNTAPSAYQIMLYSGSEWMPYTVPVANSTTSGYMSNTDWTTFNNKQDALQSGTATNQYLGWDGSKYVPRQINYSEIANTPTLTNGTVTSVGLSMPSIFSVNGSPVTSSGTLTASLASESPNKVFAGPASGSTSLQPTFRSLVNADLPSSGVTTGTYNNVTVNSKGIVTSASNQSYLTGNQTISLTGDATGSGTTSIPVTLASVNSNVGTFGNSTSVGTFTVNAKGLITSASNTAINFPVKSVNSKTGVVSLGVSDLNNVSISSLTSGQLLQYNGTNWTNIDASSLGNAYWKLGGNAVAATSNLGTTNAYDLPFITNNTERMRITSGGNIGIGLIDPNSSLEVLNSIAVRRTAGNVAQILFQQTGGEGSNPIGVGNFRLGSDGQDIVWQSGGGNKLQMGAYWGIILMGDGRVTGFPAFVPGTGSTGDGVGVTVLSQRSTSIPLAIQGYSGGQSDDLTQWRDNGGNALSIVNNNGYFGINKTSAAEALDVNGNVQFSNALMPNGNAGTSGQVLVSQGAGTAPTWMSYSTYIHSLNGLTTSDQTFATGTSGTDFNISSSGSVHTFNLPNAGTSSRGVVSTGTQTFGGNKTFNNNLIVNGSTGIGTSSLAEKLNVSGNAYLTNNGKVYFINNGTSSRYVGYGRNGDMSLVSNASGDWLRISSNTSNISFWVNGNSDVNDKPNVTFTTNNSNGSGPSVLINASDATGYTSPAANLDVNGSARIRGSAQIDGALTVNGAFSNPSDRRFKKNISKLSGTLAAIDSLNAYTYYYRTNEFKSKNFSSRKQVGMIAQEVERYFPELVVTDKEGYKALNYAQFTAVLLEAVKEQQTEIKQLKAENEQSKAELAEKVQSLEDRLDKMEALINAKNK